jgi:hypothetical protein
MIKATAGGAACAMALLKPWLRGWFFYGRAIYLQRTKRHGAGKQPWRYCFLMARHVRFIVYGQHRMMKEFEGQPDEKGRA